MAIDDPSPSLDPSPPTPLDPSPSDSPALFRSKLQSCLMAEYRTALANKALPPSSAPPSNGANLREILQSRLRAEKELSAAQREEWVYEDEEDVEMEVPSPMVFSSETRALLLARLEEEKGKAFGVLPAPVTGEEREEESKEEKLRQALAQRRASKTEAAGEAKAKELRDKLKERLMAARNGAS